MARHTNSLGKPRLLEGKKVAKLRRFAEEFERGVYDKSRDALSGLEMEVDGLAGIFLAAFDVSAFPGRITLWGSDHPYEIDYIPTEKRSPDLKKLFKLYGPNVSLSKIPADAQTPLMKRLANSSIAPEYVLWTPGQNHAPFTRAIAPEFNGLISLECMSFPGNDNVLDNTTRTGIVSNLQRQRFILYDFYRSALMRL